MISGFLTSAHQYVYASEVIDSIASVDSMNFYPIFLSRAAYTGIGCPERQTNPFLAQFH
jgi:hypothetical protein